ncbi:MULTISPECIES: DUF7006 family protein [Bacillota]|uniref:Uncharacterized protein n=1 Tax=Enterococcus gallinarum TaxID=1353 RepID=A0ABD4ZY95_ENTGA|nr:MULTISPECIES: hypothetical protein [Bacillota]MBF0824118.1 hypothetical protein [Enterococcus faecalis]MBA0946653.1 hypothetical protein [Enterococcus gallinarum]MBA0971005.1 hypothetical protein [Enterococcus gallinarum]MBF0727898.1 hypothetical protein [Enterococcus gallinarum]MBF0798005.1 hypothetical protein [Enterococcus gallinarum]
MYLKKIYFWEIQSLASFVEYERKKNSHEKVGLTNNDYYVLKIIEGLCKEARNLIKGISEENFKLTMGNLVKVDAKICLYLFFLINSQYLDYSEIQQVVDQECIEDYYDSFFFSDILNDYKLINYRNIGDGRYVEKNSNCRF